MDTELFNLPLNLSLIGRIDAGWARTAAGSVGVNLVSLLGASHLNTFRIVGASS